MTEPESLDVCGDRILAEPCQSESAEDVVAPDRKPLLLQQGVNDTVAMFDGLSGLPIRFGKTKPAVRPARNSLRRAATSAEMSTNRAEFGVLSSWDSLVPLACWIIRTVVKSSSRKEFLARGAIRRQPSLLAL